MDAAVKAQRTVKRFKVIHCKQELIGVTVLMLFTSYLQGVLEVSSDWFMLLHRGVAAAQRHH